MIYVNNKEWNLERFLNDIKLLNLLKKYNIKINNTSKKVKHNKQNKQNLIILDLDNTIISSESIMLIDKKKKKYAHSLENLKYYDFRKLRIFERPGLQDFLDYIFKYFKVGVWTAGQADYAKYIVEKFIKTPDKKYKRNIEFIWTRRQSFKSYKLYKCYKNLSMVWENFDHFNEKNTILIDDMECNVVLQDKNAMLIPEFYILNYNEDKQTLQYIMHYLSKFINKNINTSTHYIEYEPDVKTKKLLKQLNH